MPAALEHNFFKRALQCDVDFGLDDPTLQLATWPALCDFTSKEKWMLFSLEWMCIWVLFHDFQQEFPAKLNYQALAHILF